ncbi:MAG: RNA polymerase sigma factor [Tannerellaceae bacterium]|nr:RNA polymerase sigma factor [Tannerellaceae bacterium]
MNTIEQLIEGCRKEKRTSQLTLYQQFARRLYITCLQIIGNSTEAEEAMQDSFLKIFTRIGQYQPGQCFEAWMHRIAVHTAIDYVRKKHRIG